jgi:EamA-like transporter family
MLLYLLLFTRKLQNLKQPLLSHYHKCSMYATIIPSSSVSYNTLTPYDILLSRALALGNTSCVTSTTALHACCCLRNRYNAYAWALKIVPPTTVTVYSTLQPVSTAVLSLVFLGTPIRFIQVTRLLTHKYNVTLSTYMLSTTM